MSFNVKSKKNLLISLKMSLIVSVFSYSTQAGNHQDHGAADRSHQ